MKNYTLYGLRKPGEEARYIGITCQPLRKRLSGHRSRKDTNPHKKAWIAKMFREEKIRPEIVPYCVGLSEEDAGWMETLVIAELRRQKIDLVNLTAGGEGTTGYVHSEEAKKKIGSASLGNTHALGCKHTEEWKEKQGLVRQGNEFALGSKHTEEMNEKKADRQRGSKRSEETKKNMSEAQRGKKHTPERIAKNSAAQTLAWEKRRQESYLAEMWGGEFNLFGGSC